MVAEKIAKNFRGLLYSAAPGTPPDPHGGKERLENDDNDTDSQDSY